MECIKPIYIAKHDLYAPCGKCGFCGATRRGDWSIRLKFERRLHLDSKFVTLTYADPHLVWDSGGPQLHREHVQLFFKRLRKAGYKLRYYGVGEYGTKTMRPHYHVLLFGDVPERVIREQWHLGQVHIGTVTEQSVMYCLSYMCNNTWRYDFRFQNRVRPFNMMSKGIGKNYLTAAMIAWHKADRRNYINDYGVRRHLPRYYKLKLFSKVDLVRIAVRDQKALFKQMVQWLRHPVRRRMKDPLGYYEQCRRVQEQSIRFKAKEKHIF